MKALQGKKPGLRNLWGKALVVLCLAALALSGCSDGGEAGGGGTLQRGKEVLRIEVLKGPDYPSLEGWKVDLRGIKVLITYTDGSWEETTDHTRFYTVPDSNARANYQVSTDTSLGTAISTSEVYANRFVGFPIGKPAYVIDAVTAYGRPDEGGYESPYWSMALAQDYQFAEYRVLDYFLAYNHGKGETKYYPLRIPGVWDAREIEIFERELPNKEYYIDDVIDVTGYQMEIEYNTRRGLFVIDWDPGAVNSWNNTASTVVAQIGMGDGDRVRSPRVPFDARWDWSLNEPVGNAKYPFLRFNIGNRLVYGSNAYAPGTPSDTWPGQTQPASPGTSGTNIMDPDYNWNWRVVHKDHILDTLYMVKEMKVLTPPEFLTWTALENPDKIFYSDHVFAPGIRSLREEWLNTYLKDTVIEVFYEDTNGNPAPKTKTIVSRPNGGRWELPMAEYFWGNLNFDYDPGTGNINLTQGNLSGPLLRGDADNIRGEDGEDANPNHSRLVFGHMNVARRGAVRASEQVGSGSGTDSTWTVLTGWEWNRNPDKVRTVSIGPVKVYVLDDEAGLTITPNPISFPIRGDAERGSFEKLKKELTIMSWWEYALPDGTGVERVERKIEVDDSRLDYDGTRGTIIADNKLYRGGVQLDSIGFWRDPENSETYTVTFSPWRGIANTGSSAVGPGISTIAPNTAEGEMVLRIYDPALEPATP